MRVDTIERSPLSIDANAAPPAPSKHRPARSRVRGVFCGWPSPPTWRIRPVRAQSRTETPRAPSATWRWSVRSSRPEG